MIKVKSREDALAYSLSGLSYKDIQSIAAASKGDLSVSRSKYSSRLQMRKAFAEHRASQSQAAQFERERQEYAKLAAAWFGESSNMDATHLFEQHPEAELDFLRDRQEKGL